MSGRELARLGLCWGLPMAVLASALGGASAGKPQPDVARSYDILFQPGTAQLRRDAQASEKVSAATDLLLRHAWRNELKFKIVGFVPARCLPALKCAEAQLLQSRVQALLGMVESNWTPGASREALSNIVWGGTVGVDARADDVDQIRILLVPSDTSGLVSSCPAEIQVADPEMPPMEGTNGTGWVNASTRRPVAVTAKARMRAIPKNPGVALRMSFSEPITLLDQGATGGPLAQSLYDLDFAGQVLAVQPVEGLGERAAPSGSVESRASDDRKVGDFVQTWAGTPSGSANCTFRFERWILGSGRR
mgnify:CR=1 FL=1